MNILSVVMKSVGFSMIVYYNHLNGTLGVNIGSVGAILLLLSWYVLAYGFYRKL
jgi:hypothetical protein